MYKLSLLIATTFFIVVSQAQVKPILVKKQPIKVKPKVNIVNEYEDKREEADAPIDRNLITADEKDYTSQIATKYPVMTKIPGDSFLMGSEIPEWDGLSLHEVQLSSFYISKYKVTFAQYDVFCKATGRRKPSDEGFGRGNRPVINVSWLDAVAYCRWLSIKTVKKYRLPTVAEWEYAAKAGQDFFYSGSDTADVVSWHKYNSGNRTHEVGEKRANGFGLYDMSGNVAEWCYDWYRYYYDDVDDHYFGDGIVVNPTGPKKGETRTYRGSTYLDDYKDNGIMRVGNQNPDESSNSLGFRIVCNL